MRRRYLIIFASLAVCLFSAVALQGFWIHNLYIEKTEAFSRQVYDALAQVRNRVGERTNLKEMKRSLIIINGDTIVKTGSRRMTVVTEESTRVIDKSGGALHISSSASVGRAGADSIEIRSEVQNFNLVLTDGKKKPSEGEQAIKNVINKMLVEIDDRKSPEEDSTWLFPVVRSALNDRGISTPFELKLFTRNKHDTVIHLKSKGFSDERQPMFTCDLSGVRIIRNDKFLSLQFPAMDTVVLSQMKGSVGLSGIFSILLAGMFGYTIRLVSKQKRLGEVREDFMNNMNHELKTPIATISLAVDALANPSVRGDDHRFAEYSRILHEENARLNDHVDRVLQMSMLEKGTTHLCPEIVNLRELACEVVAAFQLRAAEKKAVLTVTGEPVEAVCDRMHMKAALSNLVDNALKYSGNGADIVITTNGSAGSATVTVADNGIGIKNHEREKVFDKFYRVRHGNLHDVKGFGIGLSYVKSVMDAHGGTVTAGGADGPGSVFTLKLPANAENPAG